MTANKILKIAGHFFLCGIIVFFLQSVWVIFFGGVRIHIGDFILRSTTIEFPIIALCFSLVLFFLVKGLWKEGLLFLGALLLCGAIGEIFLRWSDNPLSKPFVDYEKWYEPSKVLGHQLVPNFEGFGPLNIPVKINSQGFREDHDYEMVKAPGIVRILGLGDSFTFGWGVTLNESYLKRLEVMLQERTGEKIETINTGVPGWGLNHYYVYLKHFGLQFDPDIIILGFYNDDIPNSLQETIPPRVQYEAGLKFKGGTLHQFRMYNFAQYVGRWIRNKNRHKRLDYLYDLSNRRNKLMEREHYLLMAGGHSSNKKYYDVLNTSLQAINELAKTSGATLIVMNIPDVSLLHHPELQHINTVLKDDTDGRGIPFVDMTPIFESDPDPGTFYLHPLDPHTNAEGHLQMAKSLVSVTCDALRSKGVSCRQQ